jgi:hypothetical protein
MTVNATHPLYQARIADWRLLRDCLEGERAIQASGKVYVPPLDKQSTTEYDAYLTRGMFYGACQRTAQGLAGFVLRREPTVTWPGADEILEHAGYKGESFRQMIQKTLDQSIGMGRVGVLVDAGMGAGAGKKPKMSLYHAEHILNWDEREIDGELRPTMIVLREKVYEFGDDGFEQKETTKFRVLRLGLPTAPRVEGKDSDKFDLEAYYKNLGASIDQLVEASQANDDQGVYFVDIWRKVDGEKADEVEYVFEETIVPRANGGKFLTSIPFVIINNEDCELTPTKPPLVDMASVNVSHFRNSVDLEHGLHFTALPQAWAAGFTTNGDLTIGSSTAWVTDIPGAQAGYLEFTGQGLRPLETRMERKEKLMAVLGARLLEEQAAGVEAAETVKLRQAGDRSVLVTIADNVGGGLTKVLRIMAAWAGVQSAESAKVELNSDFDLARLDSAMMQVLFAGLQAGSISYPLFFFNLQRGEMTPDGWTEDNERAALSQGPPVTPIEKVTDEPVTDDADDAADSVADEVAGD